MNSAPSFDDYLTGVLEIAATIRPSHAPLVGARSAAAPVAIDIDCQLAITQAIALRRLKAQYRSTGFLAIPLDQYLSRLARLANVALPVEITVPKSGPLLLRLRPWLSFAHKLDVASQHLRLFVRAWFAVEINDAQASRVVMARGQRPAQSRRVPGLQEGASLQRTETELRRIESRYTPSQRIELESALVDLM